MYLVKWVRVLPNRKRLTNSLIIIGIVLSMGILLAVDLPNLLTNRQLVGVSNVESFVPIYIVYDPPGNGSYSEITVANEGQVVASFRSVEKSLVVIGEYDVGLGFGSAGGPKDERMHFVLCEELNMTWSLWHCQLFASRWYEAILESTSSLGVGVLRFDNLAGFGVWVQDLTGISGPFMYNVSLSSNQTEKLTLSYNKAKFVDIKAGFNITLFDVDFVIHVFVNTGTRRVLLNQTYFDMNEDLSFSLVSNGNMEEVSPGIVQLDDLLVWFNK
jgi:hypothetical protein